jgi:hypothetical protein
MARRLEFFDDYAGNDRDAGKLRLGRRRPALELLGIGGVI